MKRIYTLEKYKAYSKRRAEDELKKRRRRDQHASVAYQADVRRKQRARRRTRTLAVPVDFSFLDNRSETLDLFAQLQFCAAERREIYLNLAEVQHITPDALLYLVALLDHYEVSGTRLRIHGNLPNNPRCRKIVEQSGFLDHVRSNIKPPTPDGRVVRMVSSSSVDPHLAKRVADFVKKHGKDAICDEARHAIYETLIELMSNTRHHAYGDQRRKFKWYAMALYNPDKKKTACAFLDNGYGIPATVRRNLSEYFAGLAPALGAQRSTPPKESVLILSALKGAFRTSTGERYRGKGLPRIYAHATAGYLRRLIVISNHGVVECARDQAADSRTKFHGTLFTWEEPDYEDAV